ncbi:hypothetical protein L226DRAFT_216362 [Lentinus tigrinus ALCF2SS1-7]|uniref:uncharacterized protein n=1 Tax=Lentinus tigrinus ALCF2SS1-7 TaxID=1328758 RepID=UPI0011660A59|nr:hypothetical protein L226DRAFT_216362 [Lentinus tigrinus ALCF2SS1-7]
MYKQIRIHPRPAPKVVNGFIPDAECRRRRWTCWYCELAYGDEAPTTTPQEVDKLRNGVEFTCSRMLPGIHQTSLPPQPCPACRGRENCISALYLRPSGRCYVAGDERATQFRARRCSRAEVGGPPVRSPTGIRSIVAPSDG